MCTSTSSQRFFQIPIKYAEYQLHQNRRFLRRLFNNDEKQKNLIEVALKYKRSNFYKSTLVV